MKTYDKILESSYKLFLEKGFTNVSSSEIADFIDISPGTLFYYFKNKDELIITVLDKYVLGTYYDYFEKSKSNSKSTFARLKRFYKGIMGFNQYYDFDDINSEENFKKMLLLSFEGIQRYEQINKNYMEFNQKYTEYIKDLLIFGKENEEIREDIDINELVIFIKSNINGIFFLWIVQEDFDSKEVVETNIKHVWDYIKK